MRDVPKVDSDPFKKANPGLDLEVKKRATIKTGNSFIRKFASLPKDVVKANKKLIADQTRTGMPPMAKKLSMFNKGRI